MKNYLVIDANFGDSGKGRNVDFIVKNMIDDGIDKESIIVTRFSGSNNAGHTVVVDNKSFVFSSICAGSFRGVTSYLGPDVIVDCKALEAEIIKFTELTGMIPKVIVDPRCRINLPYDVMINRIKEYMRDERHGSTGTGLSETVNRSRNINITMDCVYFEDMLKVAKSFNSQFHKLVGPNTVHRINENDMNAIYELLDIKTHTNVTNKILEFINSDIIQIMTPDLSQYNCVFEGSQGLGLDVYSNHYPHVTNSRTGCHNVIDICREHNIKIDDVYYVSRPYLSRHGNDPLFIENDISDYFDIEDHTNVHNDFQGTIIYKELDITEMKNRIKLDFNLLSSQFDCQMTLAFSCMDQQRNNRYIYNENNLIRRSIDAKLVLDNIFPYSSTIYHYHPENK